MVKAVGILLVFLIASLSEAAVMGRRGRGRGGRRPRAPRQRRVSSRPEQFPVSDTQIRNSPKHNHFVCADNLRTLLQRNHYNDAVAMAFTSPMAANPLALQIGTEEGYPDFSATVTSRTVALRAARCNIEDRESFWAPLGHSNRFWNLYQQYDGGVAEVVETYRSSLHAKNTVFPNASKKKFAELIPTSLGIAKGTTKEKVRRSERTAMKRKRSNKGSEEHDGELDDVEGSGKRFQAASQLEAFVQLLENPGFHDGFFAIFCGSSEEMKEILLAELSERIQAADPKLENVKSHTRHRLVVLHQVMQAHFLWRLVAEGKAVEQFGRFLRQIPEGAGRTASLVAAFKHVSMKEAQFVLFEHVRQAVSYAYPAVFESAFIWHLCNKDVEAALIPRLLAMHVVPVRVFAKVLVSCPADAFRAISGHASLADKNAALEFPQLSEGRRAELNALVDLAPRRIIHHEASGAGSGLIVPVKKVDPALTQDLVRIENELILKFVADVHPHYDGRPLELALQLIYFCRWETLRYLFDSVPECQGNVLWSLVTNTHPVPMNILMEFFERAPREQVASTLYRVVAEKPVRLDVLCWLLENVAEQSVRWNALRSLDWPALIIATTDTKAKFIAKVLHVVKRDAPEFHQFYLEAALVSAATDDKLEWVETGLRSANRISTECFENMLVAGSSRIILWLLNNCRTFPKTLRSQRLNSLTTRALEIAVTRRMDGFKGNAFDVEDVVVVVDVPPPPPVAAVSVPPPVEIAVEHYGPGYFELSSYSQHVGKTLQAFLSHDDNRRVERLQAMVDAGWGFFVTSILRGETDLEWLLMSLPDQQRALLESHSPYGNLVDGALNGLAACDPAALQTLLSAIKACPEGATLLLTCFANRMPMVQVVDVHAWLQFFFDAIAIQDAHDRPFSHDRNPLTTNITNSVLHEILSRTIRSDTNLDLSLALAPLIQTTASSSIVFALGDRRVGMFPDVLLLGDKRTATRIASFVSPTTVEYLRKHDFEIVGTKGFKIFNKEIAFRRYNAAYLAAVHDLLLKVPVSQLPVALVDIICSYTSSVTTEDLAQFAPEVQGVYAKMTPDAIREYATVDHVVEIDPLLRPAVVNPFATIEGEPIPPLISAAIMSSSSAVSEGIIVAKRPKLSAKFGAASKPKKRLPGVPPKVLTASRTAAVDGLPSSAKQRALPQPMPIEPVSEGVPFRMGGGWQVPSGPFASLSRPASRPVAQPVSSQQPMSQQPVSRSAMNPLQHAAVTQVSGPRPPSDVLQRSSIQQGQPSIQQQGQPPIQQEGQSPSDAASEQLGRLLQVRQKVPSEATSHAFAMLPLLSQQHQEVCAAALRAAEVVDQILRQLGSQQPSIIPVSVASLPQAQAQPQPSLQPSHASCLRASPGYSSSAMGSIGSFPCQPPPDPLFAFLSNGPVSALMSSVHDAGSHFSASSSCSSSHPPDAPLDPNGFSAKAISVHLSTGSGGDASNGLPHPVSNGQAVQSARGQPSSNQQPVAADPSCDGRIVARPGALSRQPLRRRPLSVIEGDHMSTLAKPAPSLRDPSVRDVAIASGNGSGGGVASLGSGGSSDSSGGRRVGREPNVSPDDDSSSAMSLLPLSSPPAQSPPLSQSSPAQDVQVQPMSGVHVGPSRRHTGSGHSVFSIPTRDAFPKPILNHANNIASSDVGPLPTTPSPHVESLARLEPMQSRVTPSDNVHERIPAEQEKMHERMDDGI